MEMGLLLPRLHAHPLGPHGSQVLPGAVPHLGLLAGLGVISCKAAKCVEYSFSQGCSAARQYNRQQMSDITNDEQETAGKFPRGLQE